MEGNISLQRHFMSWFGLCGLGLYALFMLNDALFSSWMAGGPPNPYPEGWALRAKAQYLWAAASTLGAVGFFILVRRYPAIGPRTWLVLATAVVLAVTPLIAREMLIDQCMDSGGQWNARGLQCER